MKIFHYAPLALCLGLVTVSLFAQSSEKAGSLSGLDLSAIDKTADPCQDFYQYACGSWMKNNPIPADQSSWGTFDQLFERNQKELRAILEEAQQHQDRSPIDQKIGGFYGSCMDESTVEKRGADPLRSELERISHIGNVQDLLDETVRLHERQVGVFFSFDATPDPKNAKMTIAEVDQGGIGLPEKDFYFRTDAKSQEIRQKYVAHIGKMLSLIGVPPEEVAAKAKTIMQIETDLAKASLDVTSRRNPQLLVHEMSKADLDKLTPTFHFTQFFTRLQTPEFSVLNVAVPDFFKAFNALLEKENLNDLKDYMTWHYVTASAGRLPKAFVDENFDFYGRTLSGTTEQKPRWKRCVSATDIKLGEALGRKFVEKTFGEQGKARTLEMVGEIEKQMANDINSLTWMSPQTKKEALVKLHAVANKIGYPEKWRDYSLVNIVPDDYFGNWYRASEFEEKRQRDKIGKPVDRQEWGMTPPTVNAYYDPTQNNINFPAGILQPPFYSNQAGDAVNYGAVGVVIGHELTHGFDDEGRQFDADGNLKNWWQKSDNGKFEKLADCFVNEYGSFSPVSGVELNGKLTLGENTADNGGIRLAYAALMDDLAKKSIPLQQKADGYTQAQQFFLGFAQVWCENNRPEEERLRAQTDPHSPGKFRTNGVVSNMPQFSQAFGCKASDKMYAAKGCRVW
ncbi:MAG: M13 family metallopeptidase [Acidobacteriaceae bacterium]|nr:M13 family metallopeptidase [Acidobacteriaceae bacterium]